MKPIEIEKVTKVTHYEAIDGTTFTTEEECKKYEDTAKCVLLTKYKPLVKRTASECDIEILIQMHRLYCSGRNLNDDFYGKMRSKLEKCLKNRDIVLIGRGTEYDGYDNFYILTTLQDITDNITKGE